MKCDEAQAQLIESVYAELSPEQEARLRGHLAECDSCRHAMEALEQSHRRLKRLKEPDVRLDPGRVHRAAAARSERGRRRWRRVAIAASAAAVLMAALSATRLEVQWRPGGFTLSWGAGSPATEPVQSEATDTSPPPWSRYDERIETLEEVAQLLSAELTADDARHAAVVAELGRLARWQRDIESLARQSDQRSQLTQKDVRALYLARFSPDFHDKGAIP